MLSLRKVFQRVSPEATDFICLCMQQRFTDKERERIAQPKQGMSKTVSASELLASPWLTEVPAKSKHSDTQMLSTANPSDVSVRLSFRDLLNVSSDWKAVNQIRSEGAGPLNHVFQVKQIDRIVEAIAMTLPHGL